MNLNLSTRLFTSVILLSILSIGLFLNIFLWAYLLIMASIISFYEFNKLVKIIFKKKNYKIIIVNILSAIYLLFFVYSGYEVYKTSILNLVLILLICIFSDTGGYVIGKLIGGKKLTKISPNKTVSGSVGSFIFSIFPLIIFFIISDKNYQFFESFNLKSLVLISLFLSLICQLGDLIISYFKRRAKVKDTGSILPGHGGLLDRIDGFIFVIPVAFILQKLFL